MEKWLSTKEIAEMLGVSAVTARRYCQSGRLKGAKNPVSGQWGALEKDVIAFQTGEQPEPEALAAKTEAEKRRNDAVFESEELEAREKIALHKANIESAEGLTELVEKAEGKMSKAEDMLKKANETKTSNEETEKMLARGIAQLKEDKQEFDRKVLSGKSETKGYVEEIFKKMSTNLPKANVRLQNSNKELYWCDLVDMKHDEIISLCKAFLSAIGVPILYEEGYKGYVPEEERASHQHLRNEQGNLLGRGRDGRFQIIR